MEAIPHEFFPGDAICVSCFYQQILWRSSVKLLYSKLNFYDIIKNREISTRTNEMKVSFENFRILIPRKDDGYDTL